MLFFPKFGMLGESLGDFANELLRDAIVHWSFFISQDVALNVILFVGVGGDGLYTLITKAKDRREKKKEKSPGRSAM